jgi:hypothetical protein
MGKRILITIALLLGQNLSYAGLVKYTCQEKCFYHCKRNGQAVKNCEIRDVTTVSFHVHCECRDLKQGEILPPFFHHYRIIKTSVF